MVTSPSAISVTFASFGARSIVNVAPAGKVILTELSLPSTNVASLSHAIVLKVTALSVGDAVNFCELGVSPVVLTT